MIKKLTSPILASILFLAACSKNDDPKEPEPTTYPTDLLVSVKGPNAQAVGFDSLTYRNNKLVNISGYNFSEANTPFRSESYTYNSAGKAVNATFTYSDGELDRDTIIYKDNFLTTYSLSSTDSDTSIVTLNANGQIQQIVYKGHQIGTGTFTYEGRNLISYSLNEGTGQDVHTVNTKFTYDDHPNPHYGICRDNKLYYTSWDGPYFWPVAFLKNFMDYNAVDSYNNPLSVSITESRNGATVFTAEIKYTYEYSSKSGFPLKQGMVIKGANDELSYELTYLYSSAQ